MYEKNLYTRIVHKHDTEVNWDKAVNFIPKQAEIIVYDKDDKYEYERFKIGDGSTSVKDLPFTPYNMIDGVELNSVYQRSALATGQNSVAFGEANVITNDDKSYNLEITVVKGYDDATQSLITETYNPSGNGENSGNNTDDLAPEELPDHAEYYEDGTQILGNYSIIFNTTGAHGLRAYSEGYHTLATGDSAHAEGYDTFAAGNYSHAEGADTFAFGWNSHTEGLKNTSKGQATHTEGMRNIAVGKASHAEGLKNKTEESASSAHVEGEYNIIGGIASHGEGRKNVIYGNICEQDENGNIIKDDNYQPIVTELRGNYSHVEGFGNKIYAQYAHAEGRGNKVEITAERAHAEGDNTIALGKASHTEGGQTTSIGERSHSEGSKTTSTGYASHAEGSNYKADGSQAPTRNIEVDGVTIEVKGSNAYGHSSHAEGSQSLAYGFASHAEGSEAKAVGAYSHAEGRLTKAIGERSHAEGNTTEARGDYSHTEGTQTIATKANQHVQGAFNVEDTSNKGYAHIVGNGTSSKRSNAHTLDWDGNAWFKGKVYVGCAEDGIDKDDSSKELATTDLVTSTTPGLMDYLDKVKLDNLPANAAANIQTDWDITSDTDDAFLKNKPPIKKGTGTDSIQEGNGTEATGKYSHAEGRLAKAYGDRSHAEGTSAKAYGYSSHAEGEGTEAHGWSTHVSGVYNFIPENDKNITSEGTSNKKGSYLSVVGNGENATNRSNAYTLDWEGNAWYAGVVKIGADNKILATQDYVNETSDSIKKYIDEQMSNIEPGTGSISIKSISLEKITELFA